MDLQEWAVQLRVVGEMLADRGYDVVQPQRRCVIECKTMHVASARGRGLPTLGVFIATEHRVGINPIRELCRRAAEVALQRVLLLSRDGVTSYASKEMRGGQWRQGQLPVEIWRRAELAFNVTRHRDVPRHWVLTARERTELLSALKCRPSQLPRIYETDPVMRYMAVAAGNIVGIERHFGGLEKETYYRLVS
jgi:DNA-directed RNA polymerase I, II, and III subunit RPABC1